MIRQDPSGPGFPGVTAFDEIINCQRVKKEVIYVPDR